MARTIGKYLLIAAGSLSLALGVIGIFLPVLPTTPFLLLSLYCYLRSSARLYRWLLQSKWLGGYLHHYLTHRAVLKSTKVFSLLFLWGGLILSMILVGRWHVQAALLLVGIGVSIHLLTLKTMTSHEFKQLEAERAVQGTADA